MKRERNLSSQDEVNTGSHERNATPDDPRYVTAMANSAAVQESNVDVPIEYEDVGQFGSKMSEYNQLDPATIGVGQQHYSALSAARPSNNAATAGVYEEIR